MLCNFLFLLGSFLRIWNLLRQKNSKKSFFYDGITSVATFCKLLVEYLAWVNAGLVGDGGMDGVDWEAGKAANHLEGGIHQPSLQHIDLAQ